MDDSQECMSRINCAKRQKFVNALTRGARRRGHAGVPWPRVGVAWAAWWSERVCGDVSGRLLLARPWTSAGERTVARRQTGERVSSIWHLLDLTWRLRLVSRSPLVLTVAS